MSLRFILIILGVWIVYLFARRYLKNRPAKKGKQDSNSVEMVRCEHCGIHIPEPEVVTRDGRSYCCEAHAIEHQDKDQQ
ncbi:PP0621 family protein [Solemya velesiana gill symbiont]|uniref:Preprotein translocase subunit YajC n=1 Tax=Solemya velesiana gill symbiont TaxID=1918948 RepID=A0A1T2KVW6_9GAMM|nr:PP0621 family protein [Solemya velesiana gill symbiont]OOZ36941.1 hypothetical protein BOW51_04820 [Solemya velesiana gill symbiont]